MENTVETLTIRDRIMQPYIQSGLTLAAVVFVTVVGWLINQSGLSDVGERFPWLTAASFLFVYSIFNSLLSITSPNLNKYWTQSIPAFAVLAALSGLLAYAVSQIPIQEAGSYRWIFIVVSIGYFVFLMMMRIARNIVDFAEREEWNAPKRKR